MPRIVDLQLRTGLIESIEDPIPEREATRPDSEVAEDVDGRGLLAFPGMIDCHDHFRNLTPGLSIAEGLKLDDFLRVVWSTQAKMGPTEYRLSALLGSIQRLTTGVTTFADHCYTFHEPGLDEASLEGYVGSGARWVYARGIMTRPFDPVCETWETAERRIRDLVDSGRVRPSQLFVAPVSIRQATPDEFGRARSLADELGCGLYTHVAETAGELEVWTDEAGASPIRALDRLGFLTDRTVLVHCVFLDDGEIALLAERGCHVVHCPTNHMKLAKGFTRVPDLLAAGVNVAMGIDMMSDMLIEMRTELGMHAAYRQDPNAISKTQVMSMATFRGAHALGLPGLGTLDVGAAADIVLLDTGSILQTPVIDPVYTLLYATHPGMVRHVMVGGRLVVRHGRSTLVDEQALTDEVTSVAASYLSRIGASERIWPRRPMIGSE